MEVKGKRKSKEVLKEMSKMGIRGGETYNKVYDQIDLNTKVARKSRYANWKYKKQVEDGESRKLARVY